VLSTLHPGLPETATIKLIHHRARLSKFRGLRSNLKIRLS
jgi:hypothetical protein